MTLQWHRNALFFFFSLHKIKATSFHGHMTKYENTRNFGAENIRRWLLRGSTVCICDFSRGYNSFVRFVTSTLFSMLFSARHVFRTISKNVGEREVYRETINLPGIGWGFLMLLYRQRDSRAAHYTVNPLSSRHYPTINCRQVISDYHF